MTEESLQEVDAPLIRALLNPSAYDHDVESIRIIETHISWVILTGAYVYKIKKPIRLPFLDFSTLRLRQLFCEEELRLNRRLAPDMYLGVVPIGGSIDRPLIGVRPAIEYAVKLSEFSHGARLDERLEAQTVSPGDIRGLAETIADFHVLLPPSQHFAGPGAITEAIESNVRETGEVLRRNERLSDLDELRDWIGGECISLANTLADRRRHDAIRECHGDLHLENLAYWEGRIVPFDALEFDRNLRWIDVMDETAFLVMDLVAHDRDDLAHEYLNRYLEITGDYAGLEVLKLYLVHRAIVRAKVAALKASQHTGSAEDAEAVVDRYIGCARRLAWPEEPLLVMTHGFSGSGKTSVTNRLISELPAIRCRSDLERKRLHGLASHAKSGSTVGEGLYTRSASQSTYELLRRNAILSLRAGINVIVDAAFLDHAERDSLIRAARSERSRVRILDCRAPVSVLRQRIRTRAAENLDISEATVEVLDHQLETSEDFSREELKLVVSVDTDRDINFQELSRKLLATIDLDSP